MPYQKCRAFPFCRAVGQGRVRIRRPKIGKRLAKQGIWQAQGARIFKPWA